MFNACEDIRFRIRAALAEVVCVRPEEIDDDRDFAEYGLGSAEAALFVGALEDILGGPLPPLLVYENPTIDDLVKTLSSTAAAGK